MKTNEPAIFETTQAALAVAFLIRSQPAMQPTLLRRALIDIMESLGTLTLAQTVWLHRLYGERSSTVLFDGLNALEIRGQCAMIVDAVVQRLADAELCAVLARYAVGPEQLGGIDGLASHLVLTANASEGTLRELLLRRYLFRQSVEYSLRAIEKRTDVSRSTLGRLAAWLADECDRLELVAIRRLDETFLPHGVVRNSSMAQ